MIQRLSLVFRDLVHKDPLPAGNENFFIRFCAGTIFRHNFKVTNLKGLCEVNLIKNAEKLVLNSQEELI